MWETVASTHAPIRAVRAHYARLSIIWLSVRVHQKHRVTPSFNVPLSEVSILTYVLFIYVPSNLCDINLTKYFSDVTPINPCQPSPCGSNSQCREINSQAVCSCLPGYRGVAPSCRPECVASSECPLNQACSNQKCINPCLGACGVSSKCQIINHNPICTCSPGFTGDPFIRCTTIRKFLFYFISFIQ